MKSPLLPMPDYGVAVLRSVAEDIQAGRIHSLPFLYHVHQGDKVRFYSSSPLADDPTKVNESVDEKPVFVPVIVSKVELDSTANAPFIIHWDRPLISWAGWLP